ncbi:MAG: hypothetical protein HPY75_11260 [Actinobacteria bacterium]|nr:hypothetical protein [Actinomycetota bacterium]
MGGEIIAEKFALLRTRGGNGVAVTHLVEDTLLGERAVVKVSDGLEDIALEYLKTFNLARELELPGVLMPLEGGLLEEEAGYYMAFPELGELSLEDYLRMCGPLSGEEILWISLEILRALEGLHAAGLVHLFLNPRNVFYRPRGRVVLKDPALRGEFFARFLEEVAVPDFYYFSPAVMDGVEPGPEADLFALGMLVGRLLEEAGEKGSSPGGSKAAELARECMETGAGRVGVSARGLLRKFGGEDGEVAVAEGSVGESTPIMAVNGNQDNVVEIEVVSARAKGRGEPRCRGGLSGRRFLSQGVRKRRMVALAIVTVLCLIFLGGSGLFLVLQGGGGKAPAGSAAGGSSAGWIEGSSAGLLDRHRALLPDESPSPTGHVQETAIREEDGSAAGTVVVEGPGAVNVTDKGDEGSESEKPESASPVTSVPGAAPVAAFTISPAEGRSPLQVFLDASSSYDPDGHIVSYSWSCGRSGVSLHHVFESSVIPAMIPVTLTVTDDAGNSSSATHFVTLY